MNIETLLTPISADAPCGVNMEYEADFLRMMQLSGGKQEQQFGNTLIAAQEPDWRQVENLALRLLDKSKDLRIMLPLAQSWTAQRGLSGYADGLALIGEALTRFWEPLFPLLRQGEEDDPFMRINALRELGDEFTLARLVRQSPFIRAGGSGLTLWETVSTLENRSGMEEKYPGGPVRLLSDIHQGMSPQGHCIPVAIAACERILDILRHRLGDSALPEMSSLLAALNVLAPPVATAILSPAAAAHPGTAPASHIERMPAPVEHAAIYTRDEACRALENVKRYFMSFEPGHPAPLMIARVQQLMNQDFLAIVGNLAPEAVTQLEYFFGCTNKPQ
ncbi:type VI secretion system protein TssA [Sodalis ligni]|uniref:type VI secretion system protein TssA n=1 Tax=Sodalis ligni TaxID=2697027 RepID=UPI00193F5AA8|nr:type VI secretion system protein TssA [Sodalis ligni]QWA11545.1 type VI secretion system protein TssA [Sodalis ligni]